MRGGKREGAGRKKEKRTIASEKAREFVINKVVKDLDPIISAQIEAAKGIWFEELDIKTGERKRIYQKGPSLQTGEYLMNQVIGKATETMKLTDPAGKALKPTVIFIPRKLENEIE